MDNVYLKDIIAPAFYPIFNDIQANNHIHYWLKGGRGSTKSSFCSIICILKLLESYGKYVSGEISQNELCNVVVMRKVANSIRNSVFEQISWAINKLHCDHLFTKTKSPPEMIFKPSGQKIIFAGVDDPAKIKSLKSSNGYFKVVWFEELSEFDGIEEVRNINQSLLRGGTDFICLYSYNPPLTQANWVNFECAQPVDNRLVHSSNYLTVPKEWIGDIFFTEAELLKKTNELAYRHEYLGEVTGTGGTVFKNIVSRQITNEEISHFDNIIQGIDWGYATSAFAWVRVHYDYTRRNLYILDEIYGTELSNDVAMKRIEEKEGQFVTTYADCAEPKSIAEFNRHGFRVFPVKKGDGSRAHTMQWLRGLQSIVIDKNRTPNAWNEFMLYEFQKNKNGEWLDEYPKKNDHCLVGDTWITTDKGYKKIKNIKVGDKVLTRKGYRKVLWSGVTRKNAKVYTLKTQEGRSLTGTYDHLIWTKNGFRDIVALGYGDELCVEKQSHMMGKNGIDILTLRNEVTEYILRNLINFSTTTFGKNTKEKEKRAIIFITLMEIPQITQLITSKKSVLKNICKNILLMNGKNGRENGRIKLDHLQKVGIHLKKVINGILNMLKKRDLVNLIMDLINAKSAEQNLKRKPVLKNFAQTNVSHVIEEVLALITNNVYAQNAEKNSLSINMLKPNVAVDRVQTVTYGGISEKVYDLTVEDQHEFFANGILVHNCIDGVRYACERESQM